MAVLAHVEVEPRFAVQPGRGAFTTGRMEGDEVSAAVSGSQALRHRADDLEMRVVFDRPVAAENPDDSGVFIATPEPRAVNLRVRRRENLRSDAAPLVPLVAPRREEAHVHAECVCLRHDPVDMAEIILVGPGRIITNERCLAIRVWLVQAVELSKGDRLDHGEPLRRSLLQVTLGILARGTMK